MDLTDLNDENRSREITMEYLNFLDDSTEERIYTQKVEDLIKDNCTRLIVNLNDIRRQLPERADRLLTNFVEEIVCLEKAATELIGRIDPDFAKDRDFSVGFEGSFGCRHVNPRSLKSNFLGNLVCCEGIVTKCSLVRPKVVRSVHYCEATKKTLERRYTDMTSYDAVPTSNVYPTEDENKNPLETEFGLSVYKDHQSFTIQELPESAPAGQLPRYVDVIADEDLADVCKPGDRLRVIGLYRVLPNKQSGFSSGFFRSIIIANNIQLLSKEMVPNFESEDIKNIRKISKMKGVFDLLARSLAPSIWGHEEVKKAILCLLLGGSEKILDNRTRLRGDINVLLIGDPSVAKSQMLRYVLHTAPRSIATTGRGSSGVGLTAAVTTDPESGERRLEAGAMVLADRGIVCIDEFDKMSDIDRTAIHEVMEQGRVTIAKAGIHAKLNARCSVLAAANPYNLYKSPMENIGMQDSLLSRFDLIFVLLDEHDPNRDLAVAEHVTKLHRYREPGDADGAVVSSVFETLSTFDLRGDEISNTNEIYEKHKDCKRILTMQFIRKYIHMAKAVKPKLTSEAAEYISECYSEMRSFDTSKTDQDRTMPVTARQLETLIRLSTAMAKTRLAKTVEKSDAESAYNLLHYACFKEKPKERLEMEEKKKRQTEPDSDDEEYYSKTQENETMETDGPSSRTRGMKRRVEEIQSSSFTNSMVDSMEVESEETRTPITKKSRKESEETSIGVDRYKLFRKFIRKAFDSLESSDSMVALSIIRDSIQDQAGSQKFSEGELQAGFEKLSDENIIMIADDKITLI
uniref:DNA replication licensing factor MCM3 n=1 Tax=Syphacia muris TaxID=451379 RepID=A0A0N5ANB4_9BILA